MSKRIGLRKRVLRTVGYATLVRMIASAMGGGGRRVSICRWSWDVSGSCQMPKPLELTAKVPQDCPAVVKSVVFSDLRVQDGVKFRHVDERTFPGEPKRGKERVWKRGLPHTLMVDLEVRCRKCDACRRYKAGRWERAAARETLESARTWMVTLTLRPDELFRFKVMAQQRLASKSVKWDDLNAGDQFRAYVREINVELTLMLKRIRKHNNSFRYLLVTELHSGGGSNHGEPHFHMLLHETDATRPIRKSFLERQWRLGFSRWSLFKGTDPWDATYLCKYISKSSVARVRASGRYKDTI